VTSLVSKFVFFGLLMLGGQLAMGKEMFNGSETVLQIVDKLKAESAALNDRKVVVHTMAGSHEGTITGLGKTFLVLESDTGRSSIDKNPPKKIFVQKLILVSSITGFEFTVQK